MEKRSRYNDSRINNSGMNSAQNVKLGRYNSELIINEKYLADERKLNDYKWLLRKFFIRLVYDISIANKNGQRIIVHPF